VTKGLIFDIKRFAVHDGPGIRTTIFFKGCPLSCIWCHNPESRSPEPERSIKHIRLNGITFEREEITGKDMGIDEIVMEVEHDRVFFEESGGGVTLSGGEPLFQIDFCTELLRALKKKEFHTALDTTGYASSEEIRRVIPFVDLFLFDLKLMDDETHQKYTGVSNKQILENLKYLIKERKNVIIRFPVIPGITDTPSNIRTIINFLTPYHHITTSPQNASPWHHGTTAPLEVHLLPYHAIAENKYQRFRMENMMTQGVTTSKEELKGIKTTFESAGFQVKTGG